jgi:hypothetical protein
LTVFPAGAATITTTFAVGVLLMREARWRHLGRAPVRHSSSSRGAARQPDARVLGNALL